MTIEDVCMIRANDTGELYNFENTGGDRPRARVVLLTTVIALLFLHLASLPLACSLHRLLPESLKPQMTVVRY